mmetsp:Transcript_29354/g.94166  ORF Transcript_29354/g.94166 Transcript_29354/m.94166 type:complete len:692 (-) Transcript_29354:1627-3702(-)
MQNRSFEHRSHTERQTHAHKSNSHIIRVQGWLLRFRARVGVAPRGSSVAEITQSGTAVEDPGLRRHVRRQLDGHHEVRGHTRGAQYALTHVCLVHRQLVDVCRDLVVHLGLEVHRRNGRVHLAGARDGHLLGLCVPTRALHPEAVHEDAVVRCLRDVLCWGLQHVIFKVERVNRHLVLARVGLERARHEALREEEDGHRERHGLPVLEPITHEFDAEDEVLDPAPERLERREAHGGPYPRHGVAHEGRVHPVEVEAHHDFALDGLLEVHESGHHAANEPVELDHFLLEHNHERGEEAVLLDDECRRTGILVIKQLRRLLLEARGEVNDDLVARLPAAAAAGARLQVEHGLHELQRLLPVERRIGVLVHAEDLRVVDAGQRLEVVDDVRHGVHTGNVVDARVGEIVAGLKSLRRDELAEDAHEATAIPVVGDAPAVVDLARDEKQRAPRDLILLFEEAVHDGKARLQVRLIEGILDIPAERPKLTTLLDVRMEERDGDEQLFELVALLARLEVFLLHEACEAFEHVRLDAVRRLIGHLDAVLQHGHREVAGWRRRQKEAEVVVDLCRLGGQLHDHLLHGRHPRLCQHTVLQQHPVAALAAALHELLRHGPLALPEAHEVNAVCVPALACEAQHHVRGIGALGEDEDARRRLVEVAEDFLHRRHRCLAEALLEAVAHVALHALLQDVITEHLE